MDCGKNSSVVRQYILLRADVGRLPFPTASVAAIHAGAAIHCWPNPTAAVGIQCIAVVIDGSILDFCALKPHMLQLTGISSLMQCFGACRQLKFREC